MVDCGFDKRERDIESRQLGLLWKGLHGTALLRQILQDQEPQEWHMFAASFMPTSKSSSGTWSDTWRNWTGTRTTGMPGLRGPGMTSNHMESLHRGDSLGVPSADRELPGSELAESEELDDDLPVEVLDSDDDACH